MESEARRMRRIERLREAQYSLDQRTGALALYTPQVVVREAGSKGLGVFADTEFDPEDYLGACPVLVFRGHTLPRIVDVRRGRDISEYLFVWGKRSIAFPVGWAAHLNHSDDPNLMFTPSYREYAVDFWAVRRIGFLEELTIDYGFDPAAD